MSLHPQSKPVKIVVAEDHEEARSTLVRLIDLQDEMNVVGEAANGREAVDKARSLEPDVLLIDIRMPEMDGIQAISIIRGEHPHLKIIVLSAHEDEAYVAEAIKHGADAYILKGLSMDLIVESIREVIKGKIILSPDITAPLVKKYRQADAVLSGFYKSLYQSESNQEVIEKFLSEILAYVEGDSCCVFKGEQSGLDLHFELCWSSRSDTGSLGDEIFEWLSINAGSLVRKAHEDEPLVLNEYDYDRSTGEEANEKISLLIMPVSTWSRRRGLIICCRKKPFSSHELDMLYLYAMVGQLGLILDNLTFSEDLRSAEQASKAKDIMVEKTIRRNLEEGKVEEALFDAGTSLGTEGIIIGKLGTAEEGFTPMAAWNVDALGLREFFADSGKSVLAEVISTGCSADLECDRTETAGFSIDPESDAGMLIIPLFDIGTEEPICISGSMLTLKNGSGLDVGTISDSEDLDDAVIAGNRVDVATNGRIAANVNVVGLIGLLLPKSREFSQRDFSLLNRLAPVLSIFLQI